MNVSGVIFFPFAPKKQRSKIIIIIIIIIIIMIITPDLRLYVSDLIICKRS